MNLEELKTAWNGYNKKLAVSQRLNDELIQSMLRKGHVPEFQNCGRKIFFYCCIW